MDKPEHTEMLRLLKLENRAQAHQERGITTGNSALISRAARLAMAVQERQDRIMFRNVESYSEA